MANACTHCGIDVTWAQSRAQYGRLIRKGFTPEDARSRSPICGQCVSATVGPKTEPRRLQQAQETSGRARARIS
jgi:hypothetical protein